SQFVETGSVYVMRVPGFREARYRFFGKTVMHEIPEERCFEIDEPIHLAVAEMLVRHLRTEKKTSLLPNPIGAIAFDFDGVFTDNRVLVLDDGREGVMCNRSDGWGLSQMK